MKTAFYIVPSLFLALLFASCMNDFPNPRAENITLPIGRSFLGESSINVTINHHPSVYEIIYDQSGGYWIKISKSVFSTGDTITFRFNRCTEEFFPYASDPSDLATFLEPNYYIDSDHDSIFSRAQKIIDGYETRLEKAIQIHRYVKSNVVFEQNARRSFDNKASLTLQERTGTCMNFSRLFVALCRASEVPARTVWGIVYGYNNDNIYDYHHQWAEVMDDDGFWHPCYFNYTRNFDLNDIRYLDLIYDAETNELIKNRKKEEILLNELEYLHGYPVSTDGRVGFQLVKDARPDSMTVKFETIYLSQNN